MPGRSRFLLIFVFVVALCSMAYELLVGAVAAQLTGDAVTEFSIAVGVFLSALGVGAALSKALRDRLLYRLLWVEVGLGLAGGFSGLLLLAVDAWEGELLPAVVGVSASLGVLSGFELPLAIRLLEEEERTEGSVSAALAVDYVGGLAAALAFPLLLLPELGAIRAAFGLGLLNLAVVWVALFRFDVELAPARRLGLAAAVVTAALVMGFAGADQIEVGLAESAYPRATVRSHQTRYQKLILARAHGEVRLSINGNLQFASRDEHRYHEALVHPVMMAAARRERVLILGGGDGLAAREVLAYPGVRRVHLVDLDAEVVSLFRSDPQLAELNGGSLEDERLTAIAQDAMAYLEETAWRYDAIIVDLPDPSSLDLGKLYTRRFYALASRCLREGGALVVQSSSPFFAPDVFWCIVTTVESASRVDRPLAVHPYWASVPSFGGDWGFTLALSEGARVPSGAPPVSSRYVDERVLASLFAFPRDAARRPAPVNRLDDQALVRLYWAAQDAEE